MSKMTRNFSILVLVCLAPVLIHAASNTDEPIQALKLPDGVSPVAHYLTVGNAKLDVSRWGNILLWGAFAKGLVGMVASLTKAYLLCQFTLAKPAISNAQCFDSIWSSVYEGVISGIAASGLLSSVETKQAYLVTLRLKLQERGLLGASKPLTKLLWTTWLGQAIVALVVVGIAVKIWVKRAKNQITTEVEELES